MFSLAIDPIVRSAVATSATDILMSALGADTGTVYLNLQRLDGGATSIGLNVNPVMCEVFLPASSSQEQSAVAVRKFHEWIPGAAHTFKTT